MPALFYENQWDTWENSKVSCLTKRSVPWDAVLVILETCRRWWRSKALISIQWETPSAVWKNKILKNFPRDSDPQHSFKLSTWRSEVRRSFLQQHSEMDEFVRFVMTSHSHLGKGNHVWEMDTHSGSVYGQSSNCYRNIRSNQWLWYLVFTLLHNTCLELQDTNHLRPFEQ